MRVRARYLPLVAVLGAATAVLPANATSAGEPAISGLETNRWSPMEVTVGPSGTVIFRNASNKDAHGVLWDTYPEKPACAGVPSGGETHWEGNCKFAASGTYRFHCSVHGKAMSGAVVVSSSGTTTTTTTSTSTTGTTTTKTTPSTPDNPTTAMGGAGGGGSSPAGSGAGGQLPGAPLSSLAGSAAHLSSIQHGMALRGSVKILNAGSQLTVEVFANSGQLAVTGTHRTRVARLVRTNLAAGKVAFSVSLNRRALRTLRRRGRLGLLVRLTLAAPGGAPAHRSASVVLHAR